MRGTRSTASSSPKRPRLVFRVGVVGHRPDRLEKANLKELKDVLHGLLKFVKDTVEEFKREDEDRRFYSDEKPLLQAVSPLAEGTDRLFAEQALDLGYSLCCPMPFLKDEYKKDFDKDSAIEFENMLERAEKGAGLVKFELDADGEEEKRGEAYGTAGRIVLNQSDLLIVVWDGCGPKGEGGTVQTLRDAFHYHVPVVCVKAESPHPWTVARYETDLECLYKRAGCPLESDDATAPYDLHAIIINSLKAPPGKKHRLRADSLCESYFQERKPHFNLMFWWKAFRDLLGKKKMQLPSIRVPEFEGSVAEEWPTNVSGVMGWINGRLRSHYAWSDKLADIYADKHRSTNVLVYLLVAIAVFLALFPGVWASVAHLPVLTSVCIISELACIVIVLVLFTLSRKHRWHDRWLEYRLLAEFIRQLRVTIPWGGGVPFPARAPHLVSYGDPSQSWMYWHMRAIARATGVPSATIDSAYIDQCIDHLESLVREQRIFHEQTYLRAERISHLLHSFTACLLVFTVGSIVIHLVLHFAVGGTISWAEGVLTFISAGLPALGAALAGISNQGEFARIMKRSEAMADGLARLSDEIARVSLNSNGEKPAARLRKMSPLAVRTTDLMVGELLDWQVIFLDRPPVLPM